MKWLLAGTEAYRYDKIAGIVGTREETVDDETGDIELLVKGNRTAEKPSSSASKSASTSKK